MSVCPGCGRCRECGQRAAPAPIYSQPIPYWYWDGWHTVPYPYPTFSYPTGAGTFTLTTANTGGVL